MRPEPLASCRPAWASASIRALRAQQAPSCVACGLRTVPVASASPGMLRHLLHGGAAGAGRLGSSSLSARTTLRNHRSEQSLRKQACRTIAAATAGPTTAPAQQRTSGPAASADAGGASRSTAYPFAEIEAKWQRWVPLHLWVAAPHCLVPDTKVYPAVCACRSDQESMHATRTTGTGWIIKHSERRNLRTWTPPSPSSMHWTCFRTPGRLPPWGAATCAQTACPAV